MPEAELLEYLRKAGIEYPNLKDAIDRDAGRVLERLTSGAREMPRQFDREIFRILAFRFDREPRAVFRILHEVAASESHRSRELLETFRQNLSRHPRDGIVVLFDLAERHPELLDRNLVHELTRHLDRHAENAFKTLVQIADNRPDLIDREMIRIVLRNLERRPIDAFQILREAASRRPDFAAISLTALFECLIREPILTRKRDMLQDIMAISSKEHVERALGPSMKKPPRNADRRARVLMRVLFRHRIRRRRQNFYDALDKAAQWTHLWRFLMYLLENTASSRPVEDFLEGMHRLSLLLPHDAFGKTLAEKLDLSGAESHPLPRELGFLKQAEGFVPLYRKARKLAENADRKLRISPLQEFRDRIRAARREQKAISRRRIEATTRRRSRMDKRAVMLANRLELWRSGKLSEKEKKQLGKRVRAALHAEVLEIALDLVRHGTEEAYRVASKRIFGRDVDLREADPDILPAIIFVERLKEGNNRKYLIRLIEDRLLGRTHEWLRTEPPVLQWMKTLPKMKLDRWRAPFSKTYHVRPEDTRRERDERVIRDFDQTADLFRRLGVAHPRIRDWKTWRILFMEVWKQKDNDRTVVEEIRANLRRIQLAMEADDFAYEGEMEFSVESDPFPILFMGEYGFASCLSVDGSNFWGAVSNAIDIDKTVVWARENGNIVARRLIALTPSGIVTYRTYTNRPGLGLDPLFERFVEEYAKHCGTSVARRVRSGPLLSDAWYDDDPY